MKKKIVNALLMMAVVAPSVGSFMSCKDYNEDLNTELRSEIAKEASLRQALQTQVDNLKATVAAIKCCECDRSKYVTKVEAENTYLTQGAIQSYLDQVSANKAAIEQLQGLVNGINAKLGDLGDKPIVDQINELNTTIINVKAIADEALELAKNGGKCNCDFTEINAKIANLETLVAGWDAKLTEVNTKAANALAKAETNEAWINANKETIEALKPLVGQDVLGRLQTIENNYMKKDDITNLVNEAKTAAGEAKELAQIAMTKAEENAQTIGQLQEAIKNFVTKEEFQQELQKVNDSLNGLTAAVEKLDADLVKIKGDLTSMITGIIAQSTENPVLGYINTPFGLNQYMLAAYYGQADNGLEFPARDAKFYLNASDIEAWTPRNLEVMGIASLKDVEGYLTKQDERFVADVDGDITGNAGTIYLTVNPSNVNFTGQVLDIETSTQKASPITLSPLEPSEAELNFGVFRDTRGVENGFYSAKATLSPDSIDKAKMIIDYDAIKDAISEVLKDRSRASLADASSKVIQSFQNNLPAYALKTSWTDQSNEQIHNIYSQYNIATIAVKPLSFAFMKDAKMNRVDGFDRTRTILSRIIKGVTVRMPNFDKYKITFRSIKIGKDITTDEKGRILVPVAVIANGSDEVIEFNIEDVYGDVTETITELVDEINKRYGEGSDVDVKLAEFFNDVKESNNFQTYIDETKSSLYASIDKYLTRLEKHILRVFNNAHRSLYITMFGKQNDAIALLSMNLDLPTKAEAGELTLVPTTYSLQYFAPVYKKFVAVTNVYDAKTKAELDLGEAQSLAAVANSGENMLKVVDGLKNCTIKGEAGKIYEITYTAVDFLGVVMIKKFYVEF